jgi:hypothetical protein
MGKGIKYGVVACKHNLRQGGSGGIAAYDPLQRSQIEPAYSPWFAPDLRHPIRIILSGPRWTRSTRTQGEQHSQGLASSRSRLL